MERYLQALRHIHRNPQTFQSNFFRGNADVFAEAASRGHITCLIGGRNVGQWHITTKGLSLLDSMEA